MLTKRQLAIKRVFDVSIVFLMLPFVIFPLILLTLGGSLSTRQSGIFKQRRIGQFGKPFFCYKIRTLIGENHEGIHEIVNSETRFGGWLRKTKLDELPQLFNVLKGDMSLVGPRPDVAGYADVLQGVDRVILTVKPGITGPATLKYRNEDVLLQEQNDPKAYNDQVIWPDKIAINKEYIKNWSVTEDIKLIVASVLR